MKGWKNKTRKNNQNKKSSRRFFVFTFLSLLFKFSVHLTGADPGFFLGGGALVSCSSSTPINHIVFFFFLQNTSCIRKPQVISGGGGVRTPCTLPLDPPLISVYSKYYPYLLLPLNNMIVAFLPHPFAYYFIPGYLLRTPDYSNFFRFPFRMFDQGQKRRVWVSLCMPRAVMHKF